MSLSLEFCFTYLRTGHAVDNLKMSYIVIKTCQDGLRPRFHYCLVRIWSGESANGFHRLPKGKHNQLGAVFDLAAKQVASSVSFDGTDLGEHLCCRMPNVVRGSTSC